MSIGKAMAVAQARAVDGGRVSHRTLAPNIKRTTAKAKLWCAWILCGHIYFGINLISCFATFHENKEKNSLWKNQDEPAVTYLAHVSTVNEHIHVRRKQQRWNTT